MTTPPTPPRPERIPTDVLAQRAKQHVALVLGAYTQTDTADLLTALADRLAELAALEPVGELLAVMREPESELSLSRKPWYGGPEWRALLVDPGPRLVHVGEADTPEAALAALAAQVRG